MMNTFPYKIDLHTHSIISYDGGLTENDYKEALASGIVDGIAVTDHNRIDFAVSLQKKIGDAIIVGEEIKTLDGEVIGLFLTKQIPPGLSAKNTMDLIHKNGGLVYVPHPCEQNRSSLSYKMLMNLKEKIDIIEVFNARSFGRSKESDPVQVSLDCHIVGAASSDAHGKFGIGSAYSIIENKPKAKTLCALLQKGTRKTGFAPLIAYVYPFINKLKHALMI